jgi:hypothetical protein|tara:strand:- start:14508 stop:14753 length:246 start_codon:yes stop_codon:yes gene_type:complete
MSEDKILEILLQGGPVAILAYLIFWAYRKDRKFSEDRVRQDRIFTEDRLTKIIEADQISRKKNTEAVTELTTVLIRMNGKR